MAAELFLTRPAVLSGYHSTLFEQAVQGTLPCPHPDSVLVSVQIPICTHRLHDAHDLSSDLRVSTQVNKLCRCHFSRHLLSCFRQASTSHVLKTISWFSAGFLLLWNSLCRSCFQLHVIALPVFGCHVECVTASMWHHGLSWAWL